MWFVRITACAEDAVLTSSRFHRCGTNLSKYICPHCNVPYCSQVCYTGPAHNRCSENFAQRTLNEARSLAAHEHRHQNNTNTGTSVPIGPNRVEEAEERQYRATGEAQERARMMAILNRLEKFDLDKLDQAPEEEPESDQEIREQDLGALNFCVDSGMLSDPSALFL